MPEERAKKDSQAIAEEVLVVEPPKKPLRKRLEEATGEEQVGIRVMEEDPV